MPDDLPTVDTRLDAALAAMREPPTLSRDASARVAARAVLANAPIARATSWSLRAAAALAVVALGAAALSTVWSRNVAPALAIDFQSFFHPSAAMNVRRLFSNSGMT